MGVATENDDLAHRDPDYGLTLAIGWAVFAGRSVYPSQQVGWLRPAARFHPGNKVAGFARLDVQVDGGNPPTSEVRRGGVVSSPTTDRETLY